jgi:hypothetical protein
LAQTTVLITIYVLSTITESSMLSLLWSRFDEE